jgi:phosphohistidine phosphatase
MDENRMKIYLIRHSNAVDMAAADFENDAQRPLSVKGHDKMIMIACALKNLGVKPNIIVSSPYARAVESAKILKKVLECRKDLAINNALVPLGNASGIIGEINEKYNVDELVLVGHEPCLGELVGMLAAGAPDILVNLKYGGVCCLSIDDLRVQRLAILEWLLTPKILSHIVWPSSEI